MTSFHQDIESFLNSRYAHLENDLFASFRPCSNNQLLITIGESWTWGNFLGDNRLNDVWGARLANRMQTNWLNIARCGSSNMWIAYQLSHLYTWLDCGNEWPFDSTSIIACWTETGRELRESWEWYEYNPTSFFESIPTHITPDDLIMMLNDKIVDYTNSQIAKLSERINVKFYSCHNFCSPIYWKYSWPTVEKNWANIISEKVGIHYDNHPATSMVDFISRIKQHLVNRDDTKQSLIEHTNRAIKLFNFFRDSPMGHIPGAQHPKAEAHDIWAQYLFENLVSVY